MVCTRLKKIPAVMLQLKFSALTYMVAVPNSHYEITHGQ